VIARGEVLVPGDKSVTHRVLFLSALATGRSTFSGALAAADTRATAAVLRLLGVRVSPLGNGRVLHVEGRGLRGLVAPSKVLDCRNSGTTARLLLGALSGHPFEATLTGDRSLRRRPMSRVTVPLSDMGATIRTTEGGRLPVTIRGGPLRAYRYDSPIASAQVKTALLLASLAGSVEVQFSEPVPSRDHTERLLRLLDAPIDVEGARVTLKPVEQLPAFEGEIPGDLSSAAYLIAAAVLAEGGEVVIRSVGVNPTRAGFLRALERMGSVVEQQDRTLSLGEPAATLLARPAQLRAVEVLPEEVPSMVDEVPLLACLAARAEGTSVFRGVGELRVKESDRLALVARNLMTLGARARTEGDTLWVEGTTGPLRGRVETAGDHRLAMAFTVLGTTPGAEVAIDDTRCVAVSYPDFFRDLKSVLADA
jgi:3-phosphoshikimate 1-carboxyvinyltransferase